MGQASQPLALTDVAHGEQKGWRRHQDLIDSLPYVDSLAPEEKQAVDRMIEEEMARSSKKPADYLEELPPLPESRLKDDEILRTELQRVAAGQPMQPMDTSRYNLEPPPLSRRNDYAAWRAALDNAYSQLEHQYNRMLNLELLLKFGPDSWRLHNEELAAHVKQLQEQLGGTRRAIDALNRERKLQQTAAGHEIGALEGEYLSLVYKNQEIELACRQVEREVRQLQGAAQPAEEQQQGEGEQQQGGGEEAAQQNGQAEAMDAEGGEEEADAAA